MGKTIAELIAVGKSVEEINKMAQAEADAVAAAKSKKRIDPEEIETAREYLITDMLDYMEAITGMKISEKDADEVAKDLAEKLKVIELFIQAMDLAEVENKSKPTAKVKKEPDPMAELFNLFRLF